jgi:hypothetical protein
MRNRQGKGIHKFYELPSYEEFGIPSANAIPHLLCLRNAHVLQLLPVESASVSFGFVLVRVRVRKYFDTGPKPSTNYVLRLWSRIY